MKKSLKRLSIHRETLRSLDLGELQPVAGGDNVPPFTIKLPPTNGAYSCGCAYSTMCDSVVIC